MTAPESTPAREAQEEALTDVLRLPVQDADMLFFLLSGVLCYASPRWPALLSLKGVPQYAKLSELRKVSTAYLHLLATLPPAFLRSDAVSRTTLEAVLAREDENGFGIWDTMFGTIGEGGVNPETVMLGYGVWPAVSFFNHACAPNASRCREGRRCFFTATRDVRAGEEVCISYLLGYEGLGLEKRREFLQRIWGFTCQCVRCAEEGAAMRFRITVKHAPRGRLEAAAHAVQGDIRNKVGVIPTGLMCDLGLVSSYPRI